MIQPFPYYKLKNFWIIALTESFALNLYISTPLTNILLFTHYNTNLNIFCCSVKVIEDSFFAVNLLSSKLSAGPLPRIKISFILLLNAQINSYQRQVLAHFYQTHYQLIMKKPHIRIRISIFIQFNSSK